MKIKSNANITIIIVTNIIKIMKLLHNGTVLLLQTACLEPKIILITQAHKTYSFS